MTQGESFVSVRFRFFMLSIPLLAAVTKDRFGNPASTWKSTTCTEFETARLSAA
jgi:hypothetical protein